MPAHPTVALAYAAATLPVLSARAARQRRRGGCAPRRSSPRSLLSWSFLREAMQARRGLRRRTSQAVGLLESGFFTKVDGAEVLGTTA